LIILVIHNHLRPPSGENSVFEAEKAMLAQHGLELISYERSNHEVERYSTSRKIALPLYVVWSAKSYKEISDLIRRDNPDIAHFHNTFPLISPSAYYACKEQGVPVVQTLHNHRLFCPGGYFLRDGALCRDCVEKGLWCSVKNACYHDSKAQTAWLSAMLYIHRKLGTWTNKVDCYVTLTNFAKELYRSAGLPQEKIVVKPNFVHDLRSYMREPESFGMFIGRLGVEKGVETLLHALGKNSRPSFKLVGDGPMKSMLEGLKKKLNLENIEFCGFKPKEDTLSMLGRASFFVLPSICYEGFPMVVLEAMSLGKPVITTNLGGLPEIIKDGYSGFIVPPGDIDALADKMEILTKDRDLCKRLGQNARREYEEKYTPEKNYRMLMDIYNEVMKMRR
jgi:glycosyltransferase involved in cell wall biosynthesis